MVEHFSGLALVEAEVAMGEVDEGVNGTEKNEVGVVGLTLGLKGIITQHVTVGLVVHVVFFLKGVAVGV